MTTFYKPHSSRTASLSLKRAQRLCCRTGSLLLRPHRTPHSGQFLKSGFAPAALSRICSDRWGGLCCSLGGPVFLGLGPLPGRLPARRRQHPPTLSLPLGPALPHGRPLSLTPHSSPDLLLSCHTTSQDTASLQLTPFSFQAKSSQYSLFWRCKQPHACPRLRPQTACTCVSC